MATASGAAGRPPGWKIISAFLIVYLVWGSTYLAIRFGVEHAPPFLFASARFLLSGSLLLGYALWRGKALPTGADWQAIGLTGVLMLVGGNGLVTWSEQWIASNLAALLVATSALWLAGFGAIGAKGDALNRWTLLGLVLGFIGVGVLVDVGLSDEKIPGLVYLALLASPVCWALGSVVSRRSPTACSPLMTAAFQMLIAGAVMGAGGLAAGEGPRWHWSVDLLWPFLYLVIFGSCIAYTAYFWLVHQVTPAALGTYAYVNPFIAVLLGWWLGGERLSGSQLLGTAIILAGVATVTLSQWRQQPAGAASPAQQRE